MNYPICISEPPSSTFMHIEILPGGRNISGSTYQNIANGQSKHSFRGSSLVKPGRLVRSYGTYCSYWTFEKKK